MSVDVEDFDELWENLGGNNKISVKLQEMWNEGVSIMYLENLGKNPTCIINFYAGPPIKDMVKLISKLTGISTDQIKYTYVNNNNFMGGSRKKNQQKNDVRQKNVNYDDFSL